MENFNYGPNRGGGGGHKRLTAHELAELKILAVRPVESSDNRWLNINSDRSLPPTLRCTDGRPDSKDGTRLACSKASDIGKTIAFTMTKLEGSGHLDGGSLNASDFARGALVDNGAPYSTLRIDELIQIAPHPLPDWDPTLESFP